MQLNKAKMRFVSEPTNDISVKKSNRVSAFTEDFKGEFYNISVEKLIPFKNQARRFFDDSSLEELAQTIKEHGIRQPLTIIPSEAKEGFYEIVSGERRFRAAKLLSLPTVPCIIIHDTKKAEEVALIENVQRKNLHPIELMHAFNNLLINGVCESKNAIAEKIGVKKSFVSEIFQLQKLPLEIQDMLVQRNLKSRILLRELLHTPKESLISIVENFENKKLKGNGIPIPTVKRAYGLRLRTTVFSILSDNGELKINRNKIVKLNDEQKMQLKSLLTEIISN